jgi:hypothetical protein
MTEYSNILAALNGPKLTPQQQSENLDAFKRLQDQGVSIPDLLKRLDDLEAKVTALSEKPGQVDAELFAMMAESVKDDEGVATARRRMQAEKTRAISEMCMADAGYKAAFEAYRQAVTAAYMERKGR